jgi:glucose-1-phosphate thymidylyltransferase
MKGIILAGGRGTRLHPLTKATNKHLLPVGREPMIFHPIRQLLTAGIDDILVVTSTEHMGDVVNCLGRNERICVVLGDNIFDHSIAPYARAFAEQEAGARVLLKEVGDPERYGVAALDEHQVIDIQEKPKNPRSSFAVVGLYFYDEQVFEIIRSIRPSARGELEITSVNNAYIARKQLRYDICRGQWTDAGTFESLLEANRIMIERENRIEPQ